MKNKMNKMIKTLRKKSKQNEIKNKIRLKKIK